MNKTFLVFRHEFLAMIRRVGFIVVTLIVPLIGILAIVAYQIIAGTIEPSVEITNIGYIDEVGGFGKYTAQGNVELVRYDTVAKANEALVQEEIEQYVIITPDYFNTGIINIYTLEKQLEPPPEITTAIKDFLSSNILAGKVTDATIGLVNAPLGLISIRLTETGDIAPEQGGYGNMLIPMIFGILLVLSISFSSSYLLAGLGDEKENRLIEVLLSSVSTKQLIVGKVLGMGAAGLLQILVWVICAPLLLQVASISIGGFLSTLEITPVLLILFILYFILGYLLFAIIFVAIGAITSSTREGQQLAPIFTLLSVSPLWFASAIIFFPNNPAIIALTIFPFTAPVT
ncbi:MAG: ABC transporter permease, partial [Dehalococcoidales bacterium]|nr:ABC transporter permease [Dehalococcoidales bacterium]